MLEQAYHTESGFSLLPGYLTSSIQAELINAIDAICKVAPAFQPEMPRSGKALSVRMTNAGPFGWVASQDGGYRYQTQHPVTGLTWPPIPAAAQQIWEMLADFNLPPQCCLINFYEHPKAKMGMHRDRDESCLDAPVISLSLGDSAVFRLGGPSRKSPSQTCLLHHGDVVVMRAKARHYYHGVDRVLWGSGPSSLYGRINLTLRRVSK